MTKSRRFLRLGIYGGAVLLTGLLAVLFISGIIAPPVIFVDKSGGNTEGSFFKVGDGQLQIGSHTIRVSRHRLDMGNLPIKNLQTPAAASDAATKGYVDAAGSPTVYTIRCLTCTYAQYAPGLCNPGACASGDTDLGVRTVWERAMGERSCGFGGGALPSCDVVSAADVECKMGEAIRYCAR